MIKILLVILAILGIVFGAAFLAVFLYHKYVLKMPVTLADDYANMKKEWSTWLVAGGGFITSVMIYAPTSLIDLWNQMPSEVKGSIPPQYLMFVGVAIMLLALPAKIIKQRKLAAAPAPQVEVHREVIVNKTE